MSLVPGEKVYEQDVLETIEIVIGGETVQDTRVIGEVVRAVPNNGSVEYIRLQFHEGMSYLWGAPLGDWSELVSHDVAVETRWVLE